MDMYQHTIAKKIRVGGIGLHSGRPVSLTIKPAKANSGIRFVRADLEKKAIIPAVMGRIVDTNLATTIASDEAAVSTTEHLMAALFGLGIDNALIELDGSEVPIMDGSAGPFVHVLKKVRRRRQKSSRKMIKITREIVCRDGDRVVRILPCKGFKVTCEIDFAHDSIGRQDYTINISAKRFVDEIASARTFGFMDDVERLQENGLALGGSLDNAVVMDEAGVVNKGGLRFSDEFVRHKVLDLVGDLALLGCPVLGHVVASKSGHAQHFGLMREIVAHPECWEFVKFEKQGAKRTIKRVVTTTKTAGNKLLPFLVPPASQPLAGDSCPA